MNVLFCVFSGTGNTARVADMLASSLQNMGHHTDMYRIKKDAPMPEIGGHDAIVFGYPVHAFNAPTAMLSFLKKLPAGNAPVYLMRTSGEALRLNDASGITPRRILTKKGYTVRGEYGYVMPYNIIFRHSDEMAARMKRAAELRTARDAEEIASGKGARKRVNVFKRMVAFTLRIEHTAMPFLGKRFRAGDACVGCGLCAKLCPQNNITIVDGKPKFGKSCVGCMACAFGCPKDALKISVLNGWRVNGAYDFGGTPATDEQVCSYCHKAYLRYFHEAER